MPRSTLVVGSRPELLEIIRDLLELDGREVSTASDGAQAIAKMTTFDDDIAFEEAARAGARGFLLKHIGLDKLMAAIREVHRGGTAMRPGLSQQVERSVAGQPERAYVAADRPDALSPKEVQVLRLIATGRTNAEIA